MKEKDKDKKYRVWIEQVNASNLIVIAKDEEEAREKGYRKWCKEYAQSYVTDVVEIENS